MTGLFVAFEGGEGTGKSTQLALLATALRADGREVVTTREPGGTSLGTQLRALVLDPDGRVEPRAEALLYAADRAQHVAEVIRPALAAGAVVLTEWASGGLLPDLTVLLDLDPEVGLARAGARSTPDRLESASLAFHRDVRAAFLELAAAQPGRYLVLDAAAPAAELAAAVADRVAAVR